MYIPVYGYLDADDDHRARVERFFHVPMLILALLVLPVLALDYAQIRDEAQVMPAAPAGVHTSEPAAGSYLGQRIVDHPAMRFAVSAAMVFIWLAFLVEFVIKIAIAPSRLAYARANWLDVVIIVLPMLRPLRGARALRGVRVLRLSRLFTLRGVAMKGIRTAAAMVVGMGLARRVGGRFRNTAPVQSPVPDYASWSRAALIAEVKRLNQHVRDLERQLQKARTDPSQGPGPS